jgi:hypothetical protein
MKWLLDCLIIQLTNSNESYAHNDKRLKFLTDLTRNSNTDRDNIKLIICHYNEDIDDKVVNKHHQFKEYLRLVNAHENLTRAFPKFDNPKNLCNITNNEL